MTNTYKKPYATSADLLNHLKGCGLNIQNRMFAESAVDLIGYERLRIYFRSRRDTSIAGKPFQPGTEFGEIHALYVFDEDLRNICFRSVGRFELAFRNTISATLSHDHGSHAHLKKDCYAGPKEHVEALAQLTTAYSKSKDQRALHYSQKYGDPTLPAIWTVKEFLSFGQSVRYWQKLAGKNKANIASAFGVKDNKLFTNWLECLVDLRNACAHHDRIFNRKFQKQPRTLKQKPIPASDVTRLRALLEILDYMLVSRGMPSSLEQDVKLLIHKTPTVRPGEVGF